MIIGHVPRLKEYSRTFLYYLQNDGEIPCKITGSRRRSPLVKGALELPCVYETRKEETHKETTQIIDEIACTSGVRKNFEGGFSVRRRVQKRGIKNT